MDESEVIKRINDFYKEIEKLQHIEDMSNIESFEIKLEIKRYKDIIDELNCKLERVNQKAKKAQSDKVEYAKTFISPDVARAVEDICTNNNSENEISKEVVGIARKIELSSDSVENKEDNVKYSDYIRLMEGVNIILQRGDNRISNSKDIEKRIKRRENTKKLLSIFGFYKEEFFDRSDKE